MPNALLQEIARLGLEQEKIIEALVRHRIAKPKDLHTSITEIVNRAEGFKKQIRTEQSVQDLSRKAGMRRSRTKRFRIKKR